MKPVVGRLRADFEGKVYFHIHNVVEPRIGPLVTKLGGFHPMFVVINREKGLAEFLGGAQPEEKLRRLLEKAAP